MQKRKGLVIFLITIIVILLSIFTISLIYLKTDFLKTDKQLFYKYLFVDNQMTEMLKINTHENKKTSYTQNGKINFVYERNNDINISEQDKIANSLNEKFNNLEKLKDLTGTTQFNIDKENKKEYYEIQIEKNQEPVLNFEIVRDNRKYGWKSNQIINAYVGFESNNITELASKFGIKNEKIVTDKIDLDGMCEAISYINPEEKEHIYETYKELLIQSTDSKNYTKNKKQKININNNEYNVDSYTVTLTKAESIDCFIKILQTLKQDSITLNMICGKVRTINPESDITISKLVEKIDSYIEEINKLEKNDNEFLKIDVYVDKKIVRKIDITIEALKQISLEYEEKDGKQILQISQKNIFEEPTQITYDIMESLKSIKKIEIIKEAKFTTYRFVLYNIKDMYKAVLDEKNNNISNDNQEENNQTNIEDLKKLYEKYNNLNNESAEVSFNIKVQNENDNNKETEIYMLVLNSKVGMNITSQKEEYRNSDKNITLDNSNFMMLNSYPKESWKIIYNAIMTKGKEALKNKIGL